MVKIDRPTRAKRKQSLIDAGLAIRSLPMAGRRFVCPCCGWRLRTFTQGGLSLRSRSNGYCPRCNAKARHRRDWLYLEGNTNLFEKDLRLLHVAPKYALSRRLVRMSNLEYVAIDVERRINTTVQADVSSLPMRSATFDAVICIHVLEHVHDDRSAMREIYRVLRPGGWALITVPIRLDETTYEDPTITSPAARREAFGETSHVRFYGGDVIERLEGSGFDVTMDLADTLDAEVISKYGLLTDEHVLWCSKPQAADVDRTSRPTSRKYDPS